MTGCNFLTKSVFQLSHDLVAFLGGMTEWQRFDAILRSMQGTPAEDVATAVKTLVALSAIVEEGSSLARMEEEFQGSWTWSTPTALLHFCLKNPDHMTMVESQDLQRQKAAASEQPALYTRNDGFEVVEALPEPLQENDLLQLMARRRTVRAAAAPSITLKQLSDSLFAGLGITGETHNGIARLPLKMTPSGGARNPYEAYVYARAVDGLAPGFYHYSAIDHTLGLVRDDRLPEPAALVGGQLWANEMPCVIFLCADFGRTMWKYDDANAYRVVLIEAGHIGQNIMLAATANGLTACPTAALSHAIIEEHLGMSGLTRAPVYALTLCVPGVENGIRH